MRVPTAIKGTMIQRGEQGDRRDHGVRARPPGDGGMTPVDLTGMSVEVTVRFAAPTEDVWALLTDVGRMAGLGPEHIRARWLTPGPAVGARFEGWNRIGDHEWDVICLVTRCEPPGFVEWNVGEGPSPPPPGPTHSTPTVGDRRW